MLFDYSSETPPGLRGSSETITNIYPAQGPGAGESPVRICDYLIAKGHAGAVRFKEAGKE